MKRSSPHKYFFSILFFLSAIALPLACTPNQKILESGNTSAANSNTANAEPPAEKPVSSIDRDIEAMRNADFDFIFVFRRKDDGAMDTEDKRFFNSFTPLETNRRRVSDNGKAVIIGTNYRWDPALFKKFTERFNLEDYSKPENEIINSNANINANNDKREPNGR
jgi:hypothetical protein